MVRPERVRLGPAKGAKPDGENVVEAVVERSLYKGAGYEVIANVGLEGATSTFIVSLDPDEATAAPKAGERVSLRFSEADTLVMAGDAPP